MITCKYSSKEENLVEQEVEEHVIRRKGAQTATESEIEVRPEVGTDGTLDFCA